MNQEQKPEMNKFVIKNEQGQEIECEVLFTFDSEETKKHYIVYTDNTEDASGSTKVYASTYDPNNQNSKLEPIETEKEWAVVETILSSIQEEVKSKMENGQS